MEPAIKSIQNQMQRMSGLYHDFKYICKKSDITIRRGLREAMRIWMHKEVTKEELTRYKIMACEVKELVAAITYIKKKCDETTDENYQSTMTCIDLKCNEMKEFAP